MKNLRASDLALLVLVVVALFQTGLLLHTQGAVAAYVPLLSAGDPPGSLQGDGAAARVLAERAGVGEYVTVEDLARGALALRGGDLDGAAPLTAEEEARLGPALAQASADRTELLKIEGEIADAEGRLVEQARAIAATLTPEQRAWIVANRDMVSVGQVEQAYWDELVGE